MKRWLGRLAASCVLLLAGAYAWMHRHHVVEVVASRSAPIAEQGIPTYAEVREAQKIVGVSGPLADYMLRQKPAKGETSEPVETLQQIQPTQTVQPISHKPTA